MNLAAMSAARKSTFAMGDMEASTSTGRNQISTAAHRVGGPTDQSHDDEDSVAPLVGDLYNLGKPNDNAGQDTRADGLPRESSQNHSETTPYGLLGPARLPVMESKVQDGAESLKCPTPQLPDPSETRGRLQYGGGIAIDRSAFPDVKQEEATSDHMVQRDSPDYSDMQQAVEGAEKAFRLLQEIDGAREFGADTKEENLGRTRADALQGLWEFGSPATLLNLSPGDCAALDISAVDVLTGGMMQVGDLVDLFRRECEAFLIFHSLVLLRVCEGDCNILPLR